MSGVWSNVPVSNEPPEGTRCQHCGKRPAALRWVGTGGALDLTHGNFEWWCELCAVEAQVEYARERAAELPDLEAKLRRLTRHQEYRLEPLARYLFNTAGIFETPTVSTGGDKARFLTWSELSETQLELWYDRAIQILQLLDGLEPPAGT